MWYPRQDSATSPRLLARLATPPPSPSLGPAFESYGYQIFLRLSQRDNRKNLVPPAGFEPALRRPKRRVISISLRGLIKLGWLEGIGPSNPVPQTGVLPLNYSHHFVILFLNVNFLNYSLHRTESEVVRPTGLEPVT